MQEENLNVKKEEQVSTVYSLNSKLELVPENIIEDDYSDVNFIRRPKFYLTLFIFDVIVFIITLFVIGSGPHYEFGYLFLIILVPIIEIIFSVISIIIYEIYRKVKITNARKIK